MPHRPDAVKTAESQAPEEFGPYIVYERLGVGGMATVHRAKKRGIAGFERGVALKRMLPHLAEDVEFINSFVREAKLASMLVHPNIAQIYDFGRVGNTYFIAMEHVDGFDVRKMLRYSNRHKEPLPLNVVMSIMCELCDALEYAHTFVDEHGTPQGIVHRDVSPSNLIIAQSGHLKVIDFGIAKANARQLHTESGRVKGKLGYMSPEAVSGRAFGPVSDVFSAGVVAHELLTAHPLFSAKTDYDTLIRIHEAEIPPPSRRNQGVPAALDEVVLAALSRDPERRLQTAGAFREALEYVAEQSGVRYSARDVAEWRARIATNEDPWGGRSTSLPNQTANVSRASFPFPDSRGGLSQSARTPTGVPTGTGDRGPLSNPRIAREMPSLDGPEDEKVADMMWSDGAQRSSSVNHPIPDQSQPRVDTAHPVLAPPAIGAAINKPQKNITARAVLGGLFAVAAGLAVYQFVLRPKKPAPVAPAAPVLASVKFSIQPADSIVEIGGKQVSTTTETQLEPGVYSVIVHREGYKRWKTEVTLREADKQTVQVALEAGIAFVKLTSQPDGLVVQLDGKTLQQVTPLDSLQVPAGPHQLVVTNAGGVSWTQDFTAEVDGKYTFNAPLNTIKQQQPTPTRPAINNPAPVRQTAQQVDRTPDRTADRNGGKRTTAAISNKTDRVEETRPDPVVEQPAPVIKPDAGVPAVVTPDPPTKVATPAPVISRTPALVAVTTVTKLSGDIPTIKASSISGDSADVLSKMCIGADGRVESVKVIKSAPEISAEIQRTLMGWRYKPYVDKQGQPAPACFAMNFKVVVKRTP